MTKNEKIKMLKHALRVSNILLEMQTIKDPDFERQRQTQLILNKATIETVSK